ncbi:MD-2-related lipid recognition domain-containing family protein [Heracleum sosnowskyi]|uniref:MD-2-related lipid recognition domain-containing family protein n=1 Tax=Heracleum sosnowskyi TaxID=360622 RepID=A0AAD8GV69_9APIA|nr:MD-2-related lipid recognition domain-containing family protein [Heracleum sosnowskyi]
MLSSIRLRFFIFVASSLLLQTSLGEIICEELPNDVCAFSISTSGKRCLLENLETEKGVEYQCSTSDVVVHGMSEHIETEACVNACGVDRRMIGISSDSLLEPQLTARLCSPDCYNKCPNIIDLYFSLTAGEGVFLPDLCEKQKTNPHRAMLDLMNSGSALAPSSNDEAEEFFDSPAPLSEGDENEGDAPAPLSQSKEDSSDPASKSDAPSPFSGDESEKDTPAP